ncbi:MAG: transporter substrate-binding domain-containing protein [Nitrospina sp.]|jgi:signal transduction histidine kinase|nr:transporter substrate-binding domain-containing protein [Nitrospina sp.]MBT4048121.1 transporter substrate-binding domain-containing protein [Nitrospina sp.]MBT4559173.1 transporter substrate-binding domain-containing protein [Nitrospina sp.]MBT5347739.1 transporter substrate-binding domain-containing protein [Nitrospina sp.]MBT5652660.1 transporter substrate-binding domain-containing protein [Nitrospina sp.]
MKIMKQTLLFLTLLLCGPTLASGIEPAQEMEVNLSEEEKKWLQAHPEIRLSPDPDFLPIEYIDESGKHVGIAADYIALLQKKLKVEFKTLKFKSWTEVLEKTRNRESDMWGAATPTPQRREYMLFTKPFLELPAVIIVRKKVDRSLTLEDLKGMKVGVIAGYGIHDHIVNNYPDLQLDPVENISAGLNKVSFGMIDAMVANIALASFYIEKGGLTNLRVAGESGFIYRLALAIRNDWPELGSILDKALLQITSKERKSIYRKWVSLEQGVWARIKNIVISIGVVLFITGVITILYWNRSLKSQVQKRTQEINKKNVELQELNELKNKFLGIAAHDLRNPLTSVMGFTDLILEMDLDEQEKRKYIVTINQVGGQMLNLINDLLDVSVIESGKFEMVLRPENLKEVIENRIQLINLIAQAKQIQIKAELDDVPAIELDTERISQVLDNLLSNAIKFSKSGTTILVSLNSSDNKINFYVRDEGPGIPEQELGKLFAPFEKLSNSPTGGEKSTGLGMAIVKKFIDGHKGQISVQSKVGEGTEFKVSLPINSTVL